MKVSSYRYIACMDRVCLCIDRPEDGEIVAFFRPSIILLSTIKIIGAQVIMNIKVILKLLTAVNILNWLFTYMLV